MTIEYAAIAAPVRPSIRRTFPRKRPTRIMSMACDSWPTYMPIRMLVPNRPSLSDASGNLRDCRAAQSVSRSSFARVYLGPPSIEVLGRRADHLHVLRPVRL